MFRPTAFADHVIDVALLLVCSESGGPWRADSEAEPAAEPVQLPPGFERTTSFELPDEEAHAAEAAVVAPSAEIDMAEPSTALALKVFARFARFLMLSLSFRNSCLYASRQLQELAVLAEAARTHKTHVQWQVMDSYFRATVPDPGKEWEFKPDPSLQSVQYYR